MTNLFFDDRRFLTKSSTVRTYGKPELTADSFSAAAAVHLRERFLLCCAAGTVFGIVLPDIYTPWDISAGSNK